MMKYPLVIFALMLGCTVSASAQKTLPLSDARVRIVNTFSGDLAAIGRTDTNGKVKFEVKIDSAIFVAQLIMPERILLQSFDSSAAKRSNNNRRITMDFTLENSNGDISHRIITFSGGNSEGMLDLSGGKVEAGHFGKIVDATVSISNQ
jgi:hypothetical protein